MSKVAHVEVTLDEVPEMMQGVVRAGSVITFDENGDKIKDHQNLVDNTEYQSVEELKKDIATRLNIEKFRVEIVK